MKKIHTICFIVLGAMAFGSCKKGWLDQVPQDRTTIEQVFAHKNTVDNYLANVYSYIRDEAAQRFVGGNNGGGPWTGGSDEAEYDWGFVASNYMNVGSWDPTTGWVNDFWNNYYIAIRNATYFMQHVGECAEITNKPGGQQKLAQYIAEARALRAYYYYNLMRIFGPVIIIGDDIIAPDANLSAVQLSRRPLDTCVAYISSEFDKAANDLPDTYTGTDQGRMSKAAVLAYKAEMLLTAASPLFNGNTDYASMKNPLDSKGSGGEQLMPQTYDPNKWTTATSALKSFIDRYVPGTFDLYTNSGTFDPYLSCREVMYTDWNKEWIFARVGASVDARQYEMCPYNQGADGAIRASGGLGATQQMVDAYFTSNGRSINDPLSGYVETGFSSSDGAYTKAGTYNMYCNREPRFYVGITYNGSTWLNTTTSSGSVVTQLFYNGTSGKRVGGNDYCPTGAIVRKNFPPNTAWSNNQRPWLMLRLANIYLDYAEALNESDPGNPDILKYLNLIRTRAGVPVYGGSDIPAPASQAAMRDAIRKERRVELAFENVRYFDTHRWKIAEQTDNGAFYGMNINAGNSLQDPTFYERTIFEVRVFQKKHYLWPIPQSELNVDKMLVQNTGW
ncbi:MAG TPA: RagB/SusD family nutrient uptake outer membrane protein [Puia sp.]